MLISFHVTHSSLGASRMADAKDSLNRNGRSMISSMDGLNGYVLLSTCNRFEIYADVVDKEEGITALSEFGKRTIGTDRGWFIISGMDSIKQLFRVVSGLDSIVLGEDQIQGQVRDAYIAAQEEEHSSNMIAYLFERALFVGKRVRNETDLNAGILSVGSASVVLAERGLGSLENLTASVIGAGEMSRLIVKHLSDKRLGSIIVCNRTLSRAVELANTVDGEAVGIEELPSVISRSDVVFVATNARTHIITEDTLSMCRDGRHILLVDISAPRNVSDNVMKIPGIELFSMEEIGLMTESTLSKRRGEKETAESIIRSELDRLETEQMESMANAVISGMARKASAIREKELTMALNKLNNGVDPYTVMEDMSKSLVSKIMADSFENLKFASHRGQRELCEAATYIFGVDKKCIPRIE